jgi:tetratricopeptide (TPR) repeat protein
MKNSHGIFLILFFFFIPVLGAASIPATDPITQLFEDESDRMVINQIPYELDPVSLGFDNAAEIRLKMFLNPSFVETALSRWVDLLVVNDLLNEQAIAIDPPLLGNDSKTTPVSLPLLRARAQEFQKFNLNPIAREQYATLLRLNPNDKVSSKALKELNSGETEHHLKEGARSKKAGDLERAFLHVNRALNISPNNMEAIALKNTLVQEETLRKQLADQISKDYLKGVDLYQNSRLDLALANFVRVLNLDPNHKGALGYIEKIGEQMKAPNPQDGNAR